MKRSFRVLIAFVMLVAVVVTGSAASPGGATGIYIVVLKSGAGDADAVAGALAKAHGGEVGFVYQHALRGFSIQISAPAAIAIASSPLVAYVEADQQYTVVAQDVPTGVRRIFADENGEVDIDGSDDFRVDVDVAIIDTGIDLDHPDLNVVASTNCSGGSPFKRSCGSGGEDGHGHGTHVAGTVGALDNGTGVVGVAPGARLWAVKVLNDSGSGYNSWILAGLDYVVANAAQIEVGNMSLGGGFSQALNDGVAGAVDAGVTMVVAAGNSDADANNSSPASEPKAITVSALADFDGEPGGLGSPTCRSDVDDTLADFSNWGSVVDIAAPGVCINSTWLSGGYNVISGTSMASPHAAGAAALLASGSSTMTPSQIAQSLKDTGNLNWTDDSGDGVKERLLDVSNTSVFNPALVAGSGGDPGDSIPPAAPTGLTASAGDGSVSLDWADNTESDLASYSVYRSTTSGSSYTAIALGLTASQYTDNSVTNGTTYFYVVTALDTSGNESSLSNEASATPQSSGGGLTLTGTSTNNGSTWTATVTVSGLSPGGSVTGTWNNGTSQGCTDGDNDGVCSFSRSGIPKRTSSVTWAASSGESITINKP